MEETHDELFVAKSRREVAIERDAEIVRVVPLLGDDELQETGLVPHDLRQTPAAQVTSPVNAPSPTRKEYELFTY